MTPHHDHQQPSPRCSSTSEKAKAGEVPPWPRMETTTVLSATHVMRTYTRCKSLLACSGPLSERGQVAWLCSTGFAQSWSPRRMRAALALRDDLRAHSKHYRPLVWGIAGGVPKEPLSIVESATTPPTKYDGCCAHSPARWTAHGLLMASEPRRCDPDETKRHQSRTGEPIAKRLHHLLPARRIKLTSTVNHPRRQRPAIPLQKRHQSSSPRRGSSSFGIDEARKLVTTAMERARTLTPDLTLVLMQIFCGTPPDRGTGARVRDLRRRRPNPAPLASDQQRPTTASDPRRCAKSHCFMPKTSQRMHRPRPKGDALRHRRHHPLSTETLPAARLAESLSAQSSWPKRRRSALDAESHCTASSLPPSVHRRLLTFTARHYADASSVANVGLRRVADLSECAAEAENRTTDVEQLASALVVNPIWSPNSRSSATCCPPVTPDRSPDHVKLNALTYPNDSRLHYRAVGEYFSP